MEGVYKGTAFLAGAKQQLLIYDPKISDNEMLRTLQARAKAGVEIRVIGSVGRRAHITSHKLGSRLHARTIIRDGRQAFIGSQSLRALELDSRREVGLIVQHPKLVHTLVDTFESDWAAAVSTHESALPHARTAPDEPREHSARERAVSARETAKAVQVFTNELNPLTDSVKKAVRNAVAKAGEDVLND